MLSCGCFDFSISEGKRELCSKLWLLSNLVLTKKVDFLGEWLDTWSSNWMFSKKKLFGGKGGLDWCPISSIFTAINTTKNVYCFCYFSSVLQTVVFLLQQKKLLWRFPDCFDKESRCVKLEGLFRLVHMGDGEFLQLRNCLLKKMVHNLVASLLKI